MVRYLSILLFLMFQPYEAFADYTQTSKVRYDKQYGKSEWYEVDVHLYTGQELNIATKSYDYQSYSKYGVIFWGPDQATVLELDTFAICGVEFKRSCLPSFGNLEGEDQEGRNWEICTGQYCY